MAKNFHIRIEMHYEGGSGIVAYHHGLVSFEAAKKFLQHLEDTHVPSTGRKVKRPKK